jgi:glycerophosphoryl diester phosphodiesterase
VWVVAHRGASGHAPENTMAAFRRAVEMGARFIETDLRLTRDARVVAIHDATLDRTTTGHGPVYLCSFDEMRVLDAGAWFDSRGGGSFAGERVPTLNQVLRFAKERDIMLYLEIKPDDTWGIEHAIAGALRDSGESARVVLLCFDSRLLESLRRLDGTVMTGYLCDQPSPDLVARATDLGSRQLVPRGDLVTPALVREAHEAGLQVVAWTVNEPEQMRRLISAGADGIMTDYPDRLVRVLQDG